MVHQRERIQSFIQLHIGWLFPTFLLAILILAYGLLIPWLGFYWDDWPMQWFLQALGPGGFDQVWAMDRPLVGLLFQVTTALFGAVPWRWHVFGLLTRWLSLLAFWWALCELWPERRKQIRWALLLLAVYPGFQQQAIAVIYSHYFLVLALVGVSWAGMLAALHRSRPAMWMGLSLVCAAFGLFSMEFFIGLELARPVLLWFGLRRYRPHENRLREFAIRMLPFVVMWGAYLVWRTTFVGFRAYQPVLLTSLQEAPLQAVGHLLATIGIDLLQATGGAWLNAFKPPAISDFGRSASLLWLAASMGAGLTTGILLFLIGPDEHRRSHWGKEPFLLAAAIMLAGGWAFWIPALDLSLRFPWDRFTLGWMVGVAIFWAAAVDVFLPKQWMRVIVISMLLAAGVGAQVRSSVQFQRAWEAEQRLFWQLSWRIPALEPGTVLLTNEFPLDFVTDNSLSGVVNLMYAGAVAEGEMPYIMYDLNTRIGYGLDGLEEGLPIEHTYRATTFSGSTSQALVVYYNPPGCVRVVDQVLDDSSPTLPPLLHEAIHLSRLDLIETDIDVPASLSALLMGPEPDQTWCYYYEHADLARQEGDWEEVVRLGDVAFQLDDRPNQAEERIPFIEGYAHMGELERAAVLTREAMAHSDGIRRPLCHAWSRIAATVELDEAGVRVLEDMQTFLMCE